VSIRVLVVDDQALVRAGFRMILETQADIEVVGESADGAGAVAAAAQLTTVRRRRRRIGGTPDHHPHHL
jgi:DNA-binding NarL/FixJ family response regulator